MCPNKNRFGNKTMVRLILCSWPAPSEIQIIGKLPPSSKPTPCQTFKTK